MKRGIFLCGFTFLALLGALAATPAGQNQSAPAAAPPKAPDVRFAYGGNAAEVPAEFSGNLFFLPVRVDLSQPSLFELDTTAPFSSIDPQRAAELGLISGDASANAATTGAPAIREAVLNLPGVAFPMVPLSTSPNPEFLARNGRIYQGTLGNDFLSRVIVEIDYSRQTVRLYDPSAYQYSGKGVAFPLRFAGSVPLLRAKFTVPGHKTYDADFEVNTALPDAVILSDRYAGRHGIFSSKIRTIPDVDTEVGGSEKIALGRLHDFQVGKYEAGDVIAGFAQPGKNDRADPKIAGTIGGGYLRRFTVILDYPHKRMYLEPNSHFNDYVEADMSGLAIIARGPGLKTFEIAAVVPNTPGAEAGLQKGDIIAGVDGEAAADLSLTAVRELFRQIGHKYKLLIERNGQTLTITIQMRRLV
ncbi:MAG: PDZ domain-containing protein [Candidatus Acidiferrales bacterium]